MSIGAISGVMSVGAQHLLDAGASSKANSCWEGTKAFFGRAVSLIKTGVSKLIDLVGSLLSKVKDLYNRNPKAFLITLGGIAAAAVAAWAISKFCCTKKDDNKEAKESEKTEKKEETKESADASKAEKKEEAKEGKEAEESADASKAEKKEEAKKGKEAEESTDASKAEKKAKTSADDAPKTGETEPATEDKNAKKGKKAA